jgi:hypothetical protein
MPSDTSKYLGNKRLITFEVANKLIHFDIYAIYSDKIVAIFKGVNINVTLSVTRVHTIF